VTIGKTEDVNLPIIYIHAGLGNQLFQLAAANALCEGGNYLIDISSFNNAEDFLSKFSFNKKLNILPMKKKKFMEQKLINLIIRANYRPNRNQKTQWIYSLADLVSRNILSKIYLKGRTIVTSSNLGFDDQLIIKKAHSYLIGYFQSYVWPSKPINKNFFKDMQLIKSNFDFDYYRELSKVEKPLVVHIRLGDYLAQKSFGILSKNYFHDAIESLWNINKYKKVWIFSNEPDKVKSYVPSHLSSSCRTIDLNLNDAASTLQLMKYGYGYVLSNSTFGWWGAFLSINGDVDVVVPKPWFKIAVDPDRIIPSNWSRMSGWPIHNTREGRI
jgi:hypothetical protein